MAAVLSGRGLSKSVPGVPVPLLSDVSLDVHAGEVVAVVGRSGSGKTTLLSLLGLLGRPDAGTVSVDGRDTGALSDRARAGVRNASLGFVFQNHALLAHLDAGENVELPLLHGARADRRARRDAVRRALTLVGLGDRVRSRPRELSGGEQQRVAIARALVRSPRVILADEPTGALDVVTADHVLGALFDCVRETGAAMVVVTHDPRVSERADRVHTLDRAGLRDGVPA